MIFIDKVLYSCIEFLIRIFNDIITIFFRFKISARKEAYKV